MPYVYSYGHQVCVAFDLMCRILLLGASGHNSIGYNSTGHNYTGHNCIGHTYIGHTHIGHNYMP